ncbi:MAG: putative DNA ligase [candidate division TM6 bacterium GW2011_GWF2_38_10]|nr:MAG: putative DNA ligase [candidate division TM6 bacterium GW2011_GWF2_38_10]
MLFKELAGVFELIEREPSRNAMTALLADLFKSATAAESAIISYMALGCLNPPYIGTQFNIAEKSLLKVIARIKGVEIAQVKEDLQNVGDYGLLVAQGGWGSIVEEPLTILNVNALLVHIHNISGVGSQEVKEDLVEQLIRSLDSISAKFVVRIILGKLRLGFSDMTLLDAFSFMTRGDKSLREALENAYNLCADIGFLASVIKKDGSVGLEKITIQPGIPIRPAAAERMDDAAAIVAKLGKCVAQPKLDGFRLQVHIDKTGHEPHIFFFSRNLQDMSSMFPDLKEVALCLPVESAIIEGEAISYDLQTGSFLPFQETVKRKRKHGIDKVMQDYPLRLYFFDILYLNGDSLLEQPHTDRRLALEKLFAGKEVSKQEVMFPIEEVVITSGQLLKSYFEQNISAGLEGVVVKRTDAIYQAGKRNFNWIKYKREESGSLDDTIDCVILGYYLGQGKRAAFGIGALLVGIYNPDMDMFQTIAKIGTGMTDGEWRAQKKECDDIRIDHKPARVACAKELYPDVWVTPAIVCMIRADEITLSPLHTAGKSDVSMGFALRFPRFMGYRPDKNAEDATTVQEIATLFQHQFDKKKRN